MKRDLHITSADTRQKAAYRKDSVTRMNDKVKAENFYQDNGDKIKLNWFCYEYANNLYSAIKSSQKLAPYVTSHKPAQIADFCLYFAKRMRRSLYLKQTGTNKNIEINAQYVYEYNPKSSRKQAQTLIEAAQTAWEETTIPCSVCPSRCLLEPFELAPMFDTLAKTGWPT